MITPTVQSNGTPASERFAERMREMYAASPDRDMSLEIGVHRFIFEDEESGMRTTTYVAVGEVQPSDKSIRWGEQIRSYIFAPYRKVVDHRTGAESDDPDAVLAGNTSWLAA